MVASERSNAPGRSDKPGACPAPHNHDRGHIRRGAVKQSLSPAETSVKDPNSRQRYGFSQAVVGAWWAVLAVSPARPALVAPLAVVFV